MRNARTCFLLCIVSLPVALGTAQPTAPARRSKPASKPATPEKPTKEALNVYIQPEGFVDANGLMFYYKTLGKGEPLFMLHAGPRASHAYLLTLLLPLARFTMLVC